MFKHSKILALFFIFVFAAVLLGIPQQQEEEYVTCPVSGEKFKKSEAKATYEYEGKTYYFCCEKAKEEFVKNPEKYIQKEGEKKCEMKEAYVCPKCEGVMSDKPGKCPKCGTEMEKKMMTQEQMHAHMKAMMTQEQMHAYMKAEGKACCAMMECMSCENVEVIVENLEDGVAIKITSKDAEVVKKIQEHAAKMKAQCSKEGVKKEETKKE